MGNVHASSKSQSEETTLLQQVLFPKTVEKSRNPGTIEDLAKQCRDVFPLNFEGVKFGIHKGLSDHFQISHTLTLSSLTPSGYKFGATYVENALNRPNDPGSVLIGDIDPLGNCNAQVHYRFTDSLLARFLAQVQTGSFLSNTILDYKADTFTVSLMACNPDLLSRTGVCILHYLQNVHKNIDLGVEFAYQRNFSIAGSQVASTALCGRYSGEDYSFSVYLGGRGLDMSYYHKASEQLQIGVEFKANFHERESSTAIGYQIDMNDIVYKGMIDTNWNVGATLEKRLLPMPFTLTLSGMLNHQKNRFRLGLGFNIG